MASYNKKPKPTKTIRSLPLQTLSDRVEAAKKQKREDREAKKSIKTVKLLDKEVGKKTIKAKSLSEQRDDHYNKPEEKAKQVKLNAFRQEMMEYGENSYEEEVHGEIEFTTPQIHGRIKSVDLPKEARMEDVKKKVITDLFAAPITLIPLVGGFSSLILSWVLSSSLLALGGICGVVLGGAIFLSRLVFSSEEIVKNAYEKLKTKQVEERNLALDALDKQLREDRDSRPESCLRELRAIHAILLRESETNLACGKEILTNFENMFNLCVKKIEKTDDLWRASRGMHNSAKKKFLEEREAIVDELIETTQHLASVVRQANEIKETKENSELADMRKELERTITVARKTEERMSNLNRPNYDTKEFE